MAHFGLLHGGGFGAWSWDLVRPLLERQGHTTVAMELPLDTAGLIANTAVAERAITRTTSTAGSDDDVVLVGHALGCALLPLVAAATGAGTMVWVCGIIPVNGKSCADQIARDRTMVPMFDGRAYAEVGARAPRVMAESLFPDCDPETKEWAIGMMAAADPVERVDRASPTVVTEPFPDEPWPVARVEYVLGTDDRALAPEWCRRAARERLGVEPRELPGGHSPLLSRPEALAAVLLEVAGGSASRDA